MNEKITLERAACNYFLESYNRLNGTKLEIKKHRDKPDFLAEDSVSGQAIGIEVAHLCYDDNEAKMLLGRSYPKMHGPMNLEYLIQELNSLLEGKNNKAMKYNFRNRMFLIIRVLSPVFDKSSFDMFETRIVIPKNNVFSEIWLVFYDFSRQEWGELKHLL